LRWRRKKIRMKRKQELDGLRTRVITFEDFWDIDK
jgi:hypothetical protein